jgi:adenosylcobinamide-phosphate guanylyltransferase
MIAILLAGGRSRRLGGLEKPLVEISGFRMIDRVAEAVEKSAVDHFYVAVSPHTPRTEEYCLGRGYRLLKTRGEGYVEDLLSLLKAHPVFLSVAVDLPFLTPEAIDQVLEGYEGHSVTGAVPLNILPPGVKPSFILSFRGERLVAIGLNIATKSNLSRVVVLNDPLLAINVNDLHDLKAAQSMATRNKKGTI